MKCFWIGIGEALIYIVEDFVAYNSVIMMNY